MKCDICKKEEGTEKALKDIGLRSGEQILRIEKMLCLDCFKENVK